MDKSAFLCVQPIILRNDYVITPCLDPNQTLLCHETTTTADYMLVFVLQKLLSLLALLKQNICVLCWVCTQRARFMHMLQVFFSVFSLSLWHNYSTTYWSGMYTTSFWVVFSGLCVRRYFLRWNSVHRIFFQNEEKNDWIGKALASCGRGLRNTPHIPPFHQQEPGASSEPVLLPVLSWFDWRAL